MIKKAAKAPKTPTKKAAAPSTKPHALSKGVNFSKSFFNASLKPAEKIHFLREMLRIRRFEQQALKHYNQGTWVAFFTSTSAKSLSPSAQLPLTGDLDKGPPLMRN